MINDQAILEKTVALNEYAFYQAINTQGEATLRSSSECLLLFVLQGGVRLDTNKGATKIAQGNFIAIRKNSLQKITCAKNTTLLEYTPAELVCTYFERCNRGFRTPYSSVVPILPSLEQWIEKILHPTTEPFDHEKTDIALTKLLINYPEHYLGELYVPFYAHHLHLENLKKIGIAAQMENTVKLTL